MLNVFKKINYIIKKNSFCEHPQIKYWHKDITEKTYMEYQHCCKCGRNREIIHSLGSVVYDDWYMPIYDNWHIERKTSGK